MLQETVLISAAYQYGMLTNSLMLSTLNRCYKILNVYKPK